ncbi:hypothetical protein E2C01_079176 [Portunus trituberculatus]|uniref:Uncharacterized protein n=1 Tax=Portunus trituberculatus TaxID=210409 RepID=A0A5B7IUV7_PORTR|nr:hypothetical protein [Portunus trituberculatus]
MLLYPCFPLPPGPVIIIIHLPPLHRRRCFDHFTIFHLTLPPRPAAHRRPYLITLSQKLQGLPVAYTSPCHRPLLRLPDPSSCAAVNHSLLTFQPTYMRE